MNPPEGGKPKRSFLKGFIILLALSLLFVLLVMIIPFGADSDDATFTIGKDKIGVVEVFGPITGADSTVRQIEKYAKDSSIKGILVHIDSPGGAVAPSQEIYEALLKARKKKKVVASMATLAASGGFYIAVGADRIVANPGTITGSIGVIMGFADVRKLMSKLGVESIVVKSGQFKDIGTSARPFTDADREMLEGVIDDVYMQFVAAVAKQRHMEISKVKKIADGRIFSGRQGKELGMVDQLGTFRDAVKLLASLTGITGEPVLVREREKFSWLKQILDSRLGWFWKNAPFTGPGLYYLWTL
ncbi:MAG: signal peptide peptidase SppA [Nitrospinota bacterium]